MDGWSRTRFHFGNRWFFSVSVNILFVEPTLHRFSFLHSCQPSFLILSFMLAASPSPHFRFISLRFISFRFISFGTRSSFLVAREPPIHPAPTFVAHPPTPLREGGEGGERGGSVQGRVWEGEEGRGMVVLRRGWNRRAGMAEIQPARNWAGWIYKWKRQAMEADALGSADVAGIAELEQVDIQPARSWLDNQVEATAMEVSWRCWNCRTGMVEIQPARNVSRMDLQVEAMAMIVHKVPGHRKGWRFEEFFRRVTFHLVSVFHHIIMFRPVLSCHRQLLRHRSESFDSILCFQYYDIPKETPAPSGGIAGSGP